MFNRYYIGPLQAIGKICHSDFEKGCPSSFVFHYCTPMQQWLSASTALASKQDLKEIDILHGNAK